VNFFPHGHCYRWDPTLITVSAVADLAVALSYSAIPIALLIARRKSRHVVPRPLLEIAGLFAGFIFACGTGHLIAIMTIWRPAFWLEACWKLGAIATISIYAAVRLYRERAAFSRAMDAVEREFRVDRE